MAGSSQLAWIGGMNSQVFNGTSYRPTQNRFALRRPSYDLQRLKIVPVPSLHFKIGRPFLEETGSLFSWHKIFPQQLCPYIHLTSVSCAARAVMPSKEIVVTTLKGVPTLVASVLSVLHGHTRSTLLSLQSYPLALQLAPAIGIFLFASWGLSPCMYMVHRSILKGGRDWEKSQAKHIMTSYLRPLMLWMAVITVCRALDPVLLSSERSQAIKERVINFVRSLSTVLAFAFCTHRLTQQLQNFMMERHNSEDARNLGFHFIGSAVSTSVWVAAVCLFMELLGFSTQKWITAGGFGTVLVTLAGREIFTNFLSSVMIHATRPFVESEWIQTKIDGQEVSGTVEHVGWWSPTVIRGDDREAVHIPNHKFTVSIVRNLSQKTHWRIKTHIGISHYDVNKISLIVADMRKVLSKHPQVEHKRLHRRVFFDNIDPENQALMILVSCFVKTSHFEEYLRVKEIILLNLLKVISHHNARLATPIRSVQRVLDESETRQSPFRNARNAEGNRPFLLGEASTLIEPSEMVLKPESSSKASRAEAVDSELEASKSPSIVAEETGELKVKQKKTEGSTDSEKNPIADISQQKPQLEGLDSMGLNSKDISLLGAAFEKPPAKISEGPIGSGNHADIAKPSGKASEIVIENTDREIAELEKVSITNSQQRADGRLDKAVDNKVKPAEETPEDEKVRLKVNNNTAVIEDTTRKESKGSDDDDDDPWRQQGPSPTQKQDNVSRNSQFLEENLVLGVALDGPKRTLPLDDEVEQKERIILKNGNSSKERHEKPQQSTPAVIEER